MITQPLRTPPWAVLLAAAIAAVAGVVAVVTAAGVAAVVAGTASVVTAVLVLAGRQQPATASWPADATHAADPAASASPPAPEPSASGSADDPEVDPIRALFEAGPPAGGQSLLGAEFVLTTLRGRIAVARRALRPLSVVCFEVYETTGGQPTEPLAADAVAATLRRTLREADVAGHTDRAGFVCILEDTGEDGAVWTAERIRRSLADENPHRRFRAGIASYPSHGLEPEELEEKARTALSAARDWGRDRIEVATAS